MSIYLRKDIWWTNFWFHGVHVQETTGCRTPRKATEYEAERRTEVRKQWEERDDKAKQLGCQPEELRACAECSGLFYFGATADPSERLFCGEVCEETFRKRQSPVPTLSQFLQKQFLPYVLTTHKDKPNTLRYYQCGITSLEGSHLADLRLDRITNEHATQYAAKLRKLSASTVNLGLRTLRRAIYLAAEWGTITTRPRIKLATGEKQRDRVLTDDEVRLYLNSCAQPWRDCAVILLGCACRPGEAFALRWEHVQLNGSGGTLRIAEGKSAAAKRTLPLVPAVYGALEFRWETAGKPDAGWVFPAQTKSGHLEGDTAKNYHARALALASRNGTPLKTFPPYTFRHTALTRLAESGCDAFVLARIAGHSSITITQRYCHPQAEAMELAFSRLQKVTTSPTTKGNRAKAVPRLSH
jgi:integrase